jgi:nucleoside-diphosphate-sugar epimerase
MAAEPVDLKGKKVLITGVTGQVARPLVQAYAKIADVYAMARYGKDADRKEMESYGAKAVAADLAKPETLAAIPGDLDYVINCAVVKTGHFEHDLQANAEGVGHLIARTKNVKAFLHFSTTGVYEYQGHALIKETDPLADNHRSMMPTYSISKIATESVCRFAAKHFGVATTIARLNVPYGDNGGWPAMHLHAMRAGHPILVHPEGPNYYNPIHADDYIEKVPRLLAVASKDITTTNFGGSERVSIEEWVDYMAEITGLKPNYKQSTMAFGSIAIDPTRMHALIGETKTNWKEGIKRMVRAQAPELLPLNV